MAKYCSDCAYMDTNPTRDFRYKCTNSKSRYDLVAACMQSCPHFCDCFSSRRSSREAEELYKSSKGHGWYIVTAISHILNYSTENIFIYNFSRFCNEVLPNLEDGLEWLDEYNEIAPSIAGKLLIDDNNVELAISIMNDYLYDFVDSLDRDLKQESFNIYDSLYQMLKKRYIIDERTPSI